MNNIEMSKTLLKKYFGYDSFRPYQEKIIESILKKKDTLAIMPTGAGKSICFQIPALILQGLTIVISPLISLMKDQVDSLKTEGISATFLNTSLTRDEIYSRINALKNEKYKLLYIAPEKLNTYDMAEIANEVNISMIAIDEAHCLSHWGHDFRPHYKDIFPFVNSLKTRPIVTAFTATATREVRDDICSLLRLKEPAVFVSGFDRPNLFFKVFRNIDKDDFVSRYISEHRNESGIIYASTQKEVERLHLFLLQQNVKAARYHGGLSEYERTSAQGDFLYDRAEVIVATLAFGMGIDKSNVRYVIHYNMPKSVEGYYQEAGRAGRDGEKSECILLYAPKDVETQRYLITHPTDANELAPARISYNMSLLKKMVNYCHTPNCLRKYLLDYFGDDEAKEECGNCENCKTLTEKKDITREAQMVISCVYRIQKHCGISYGSKVVVDVLRGSKAQRVYDLGLQNVSTYGLMKDRNRKEISELINTLTAMDYIGVTDSEFPTLYLTDKAVKMLKNKERVICSVKHSDKKEPMASKKTAVNTAVINEVMDEELYDKLKKLRKEIADSKHLPAFMIFSDAALRSMIKIMPKDRQEFLSVQGVGEKKLEEFGDEFLRVINE